MSHIRVGYAKSFLRMLKVQPENIRSEARNAIKAFGNRENHERLNVHKLQGRLNDRYAFSVNYHIRIVFMWEDAATAVLLKIGDHRIYQ